MKQCDELPCTTEHINDRSVNDIQIGGNHYKGSKFQHWDLVTETKIGYLLGCATKYVFRWRTKGGFLDLEKACHYLQKHLSVISFSERDISQRELNDLLPTVSLFCLSNGVGVYESNIITKIVTWKTPGDIMEAHEKIQKLLRAGREL